MTEIRIPLDKWFEVKVKKLDHDIEQVADEVATEGEAIVKAKIETSGTGRTWARTYYKRGKARSGSYPGRVWTGDMRDDVEHKVTSRSDVTVASFGWINNYEEYYGLQEGGFEHDVTHDIIEPMFAMGDAEDSIQQIVKQKMRGILREF